MGFNHPEFIPWLIISTMAVLGLFLWNILGRYRPFFKQFGDWRWLCSVRQAYGWGRLSLWMLCATAVFFLLGAVVVGPYRIKKVSEPRYEGMQIVYVLDGSLSMLAEDVKPSRFDRALMEIKAVTEDLKGKGDRLGLVIFAEIGIPYVPFLTADQSTFLWYLQTVDRVLLETELPQGSTISDGLLEGLKLFTDEHKKKILVLITDGEPADVADPGQRYLQEKFAEAAQRYGELHNISIFLIGIGDPSRKSLIPQREADGRLVGYYRYEDGPHQDEFLLTSPHLWFLRDLTKMFGGVFKHSTTGHDLQQLMKGVIEAKRPVARWVTKEHPEPLAPYLLRAVLVLLVFFIILKSP